MKHVSQFLSHVLCIFAMLVLEAAVLLPQTASAQKVSTLRIGVVDLNAAINRTTAGRRSKKVLLASQAEKTKHLKAKELQLSQQIKLLQQNIVLKAAARKRKEGDLRKQRQDLQQEAQKAQASLQRQERKLTEALYIELRQVVRKIAAREKLDVVLEKGAAQAILYIKNDFIDVTNALIKEHDSLSQSRK